MEEFRHRVWSAEAAVGTTLQDALEPGYWATVSVGPERSMRKKDRILLRHESNEFYAELFVIDAAQGWAKVKVIHSLQIEENTAKGEDGAALVAKWRVNARSFDVVRKIDGEILHTGFGTKADALIWIDEHNQKVAA